jgi:hypothetical protein
MQIRHRSLFCSTELTPSLPRAKTSNQSAVSLPRATRARDRCKVPRRKKNRTYGWPVLYFLVLRRSFVPREILLSSINTSWCGAPCATLLCLMHGGGEEAGTAEMGSTRQRQLYRSIERFPSSKRAVSAVTNFASSYCTHDYHMIVALCRFYMRCGAGCPLHNIEAA